jgi:lipopolysaccharide export system protein LptA
MKVNNQKRTVHFFDDVEVLHLPADDPGLQWVFDRIVDKLPANAMHLRCARMTVFTAKDAQGRPRQNMEARGKVAVRWENEFEGHADVVKFDEASQRVILEAADGTYATVRKLRAQQGGGNRIMARKITYNRLTGDWKTEDVFSISND